MLVGGEREVGGGQGAMVVPSWGPPPEPMSGFHSTHLAPPSRYPTCVAFQSHHHHHPPAFGGPTIALSILLKHAFAMALNLLSVFFFEAK